MPSITTTATRKDFLTLVVACSWVHFPTAVLILYDGHPIGQTIGQEEERLKRLVMTYVEYMTKAIFVSPALFPGFIALIKGAQLLLGGLGPSWVRLF